MDPEARRLLEENNKILRQMRSAQRWGVVFQTIKWVIILGLALGSFYYLEPYLNQIRDFYGSVNGVLPG